MSSVIPEQDERDGPVVSVRENGRKRVVTMNYTESCTVQSDVVESDIKALMRRYEGVGILPTLRAADLKYRDVSEFEDYADAMRHAEQVRGEFMELDPRIRKVFKNDHLVWLDAAKDGLDPDQHAALEKLGIIKKVEVEPPPPAVVDPPPASE